MPARERGKTNPRGQDRFNVLIVDNRVEAAVLAEAREFSMNGCVLKESLWRIGIDQT